MGSIVKKIGLKLTRLFIGLFMCALGISLTINANLGVAPWDVLHQGLANRLGITLGTAAIGMGFLVVILDVVLGENVGWATIFNMILIGIFLDILLLNNMIPIANGFISGIIMLCLGMIIMGVGMILYIGTGLGSGPRDGLMVALQKKTNKPVKAIRGIIECSVLVIGYFLGGNVGIGTVITAIGIGHVIQVTFKVFKFEIVNIEHRFIIDDINKIKNYLTKQPEIEDSENSQGEACFYNE